jgi:hypothetical protein
VTTPLFRVRVRGLGLEGEGERVLGLADWIVGGFRVSRFRVRGLGLGLEGFRVRVRVRGF